MVLLHRQQYLDGHRHDQRWRSKAKHQVDHDDAGEKCSIFMQLCKVPYYYGITDKTNAREGSSNRGVGREEA
jgi:hypothetical protein